MSLDADLTKAVASIVQTAKDLSDADSGLRVELASIAAQVQVERGITRDMVEAVDRRMDAFERRMDDFDRNFTKLVAAVETIAKEVRRG